MSVNISNVTFTYNQGTQQSRLALKDVSLKVDKGEFLAVIGHSGSGKSTLVQMLNGLLKPDFGQVIVNGMNTKNKDLKELRQQVGMVFQYPEHQLFAETVFDDIAFGVKKLGLSESEIKERVLDTAKLLGIREALLTHSPFELSGGEKRRVAMAGVISMSPNILVLDEPAAGLDPEGKREIFKLIKKLNKEREMTIIMVSHSMEDVANVANRVAVLVDGKIKMIGSPSEIFSNRESLRKVNLDVPEITNFMAMLSKQVSGIDETCISVLQAKKLLLKRLGGGVKC